MYTEHFLAKVTIFCCFDVSSVWPPQIFQVQAKISTVRPVFPDYLSISYDYDYIELLCRTYEKKNSNLNFMSSIDFQASEILILFGNIYFLASFETIFWQI